MANLTETANWETGIYQIETTDLVLGGPAGVANLQPKQLANRTAWLKVQLEALAAKAFPSGTRLHFPQASAPTGWTQITTDDADNRMLRVVTGAGGGIGGTHSPILMNVVPAHTHGFNTDTGDQSADHSHSFSGNTGGESQGHTHNYRFTDINTADSSTGGGDGAAVVKISTVTVDITDNHTTTDVSQDHSHGFSGTTAGVTANHHHNVSGTTDNGSSSANWTPRYVDLILAQAD
jgi:hypothetical protein